METVGAGNLETEAGCRTHGNLFSKAASNLCQEQSQLPMPTYKRGELFALARSSEGNKLRGLFIVLA